MKTNYEWCWSRFGEPTLLTGYSGVLSFRKIAFLLVVAVCIVLCVTAKMCLGSAVAVIGILGFILLAPFCRPTEVIKLYKGEIYVFSKKTKSQITYELIDPRNHEMYVATDYETFTQALGTNIGFLIFKDNYTKSWYYLCAEDKPPVKMGYRLGKTLFVNEENADKKQLSILADGRREHLTVQSFFYKNFGITTPLSGKSAPDELLLVKTEGIYKLYGLYTGEDEPLRYRELNYYDIGDMGIYFYEDNALVYLKCTPNGILKTASQKIV
ncbi:MAG: hypothetical protein J6C85_06435 [Alphaproteobacteria bacterium]|nr:hypothetical protein [Alphaproteobacteria bacterium]